MLNVVCSGTHVPLAGSKRAARSGSSEPGRSRPPRIVRAGQEERARGLEARDCPTMENAMPSVPRRPGTPFGQSDSAVVGEAVRGDRHARVRRERAARRAHVDERAGTGRRGCRRTPRSPSAVSVAASEPAGAPPLKVTVDDEAESGWSGRTGSPPARWTSTAPT